MTSNSELEDYLVAKEDLIPVPNLPRERPPLNCTLVAGMTLRKNDFSGPARRVWGRTDSSRISQEF